jgi:hypothetical protein
MLESEGKFREIDEAIQKLYEEFDNLLEREFSSELSDHERNILEKQLDDILREVDFLNIKRSNLYVLEFGNPDDKIKLIYGRNGDKLMEITKEEYEKQLKEMSENDPWNFENLKEEK